MSSSESTPYTGGFSSTRPRRPARHSSAAFAVAAVLGTAIWASWLGWDRTASYDRITGTVQDPYVTLQVLGCAMTVGLVVAVLAARQRPLTGAGGVALGFWVPWTVDAATQDDSGLFAVGALLLAIGLAVGTTVAAVIGIGAGAARRAAKPRRGATAG